MPAPFRHLPVVARLFILGALAAAVAGVALTSQDGLQRADVALLITATVLCALANVYEVLATGNFSFQPNLIFFFAGAALLPPWAIAVMAIASYLPGVVLRRPRWYMTAFNVANYALAGLVVHHIVGLEGAAFLAPPGGVDVALLFLAAAVAVALNHLLVALAIATSQGRSLTRVVASLSATLPLDLALAITGGALVVLWTVSPLLTLLAVGPMIMVYQALWVPALRHKSRTDPKTGLFHADHFREELGDAIEAAGRDGATVGLLMLDLDRLRAVNNRFGHLAGDELIERTARLLEREAPEGAVAARFGGEEFSLMLPGATTREASVVADRVRTALEHEVWDWGAGEHFMATVSIGVAAFPEHADSPDQLIAIADAALYDAKIGGRNRVRRPMAGQLEPRQRHVAMPGVALPRVAGPPAVSLPPVAVPAPAAAETPMEAVELVEAVVAAEEAPVLGPERNPRPRGVVALTVVMCLLTGVSAAFLMASGTRIETPIVFVLLIVGFIVLDHVRIDLFERAHISPAAAPVLALAFLFGPVGPLAAEAFLAALRASRRDAALKYTFDFGSLGLAGVAAAGVYLALAPRSGLAIMAAASLGGIVYYLVNAGTLCLVMAMNEGTRLRSVWAERLAWLWPQYLGFGLIAGAFVVLEHDHGAFSILFFGVPLGLLWIAEKQYVGRSRDSVVELRNHRDELEVTNARLRGLLSTNQDLLRSMQRSYLSTITSLARTIEAKDPYTGGHTERVGDIARMLAVEIGMDETDLRAIEVGAVIHDIGKIGVPDEILLKPGRLTDDEFDEMRRHPEISSYIVSELDLPPIVKQMVRSHHERWDGGGYPDGLSGEEIPLAARILSVADTLDAMTSDRSYRAALPLATAIEEIRMNAGRQFCPRVVDAFMRCFQRDATLGGKFGVGGRPPGPPAAPASSKSAVA